ncbi:MAG: hypothetical protein IK088_09775 [Lachnospiraceae bacterium]|nr:hypothetical protein [Lachnospiraceae bacterium]
MERYTVPKIDGREDLPFLKSLPIAHAEWTGKWNASRFTGLSVEQACRFFSAEARIGYTNDAFFVRLSAHEAELRREETGPVGAPCEDSCLEFFFSPDPSGKRYFNIEMNPNACFYFGIGTSIETLVRLRPEHDPDPFEAVAEIDGNDWSVTYRIPLELIRMFFPEFTFAPGVKLRANFFHCGDSTVFPHFLSWSPMDTDKISYHQPDFFGELTLE